MMKPTLFLGRAMYVPLPFSKLLTICLDPSERGTAPLIKTPNFLYRFFPSVVGGVGGFGSTTNRRATERPAGRDGHFWGQGQAVGGN